jgi:hypothetical protein
MGGCQLYRTEVDTSGNSSPFESQICQEFLLLHVLYTGSGTHPASPPKHSSFCIYYIPALEPTQPSLQNTLASAYITYRLWNPPSLPSKKLLLLHIYYIPALEPIQPPLQKNFCFCIHYIPALGPIQPPVQWTSRTSPRG